MIQIRKWDDAGVTALREPLDVSEGREWNCQEKNEEELGKECFVSHGLILRLSFSVGKALRSLSKLSLEQSFQSHRAVDCK